jgi:hypothetical protein
MPALTTSVTDQLTAGSDLNRAAVSWSGRRQALLYPLPSGSDLNQAQSGAPWPHIINGAVKFFNAWRANGFQGTKQVKINANYGETASLANYGFRGREFGGIGNMPGPDPSAKRPMYNNLVPIVYHMRVVDPRSQAQMGELATYQKLQVGPAEFTPTGTASLKEVLL